MEIRQIPDYPNYGVTRDGRVWSYNRNRFVKCLARPQGYVVGLWHDGLRFFKLVRRLVFEAFTGKYADCVYHKDGNVFNNQLDNLEGLDKHDFYKMIRRRRKHSVRPICRINIATGKADMIEVRKKDKSYGRIHQVIQRKSITSGGCFYYYPGEKGELIAEIKAHIYSNQLSLKSLKERDKYSPYIPVIKKHIKTHQKYIEVLKGINDEQNNNL